MLPSGIEFDRYKASSVEMGDREHYLSGGVRVDEEFWEGISSLRIPSSNFTSLHSVEAVELEEGRLVSLVIDNNRRWGVYRVSRPGSKWGHKVVFDPCEGQAEDVSVLYSGGDVLRHLGGKEIMEKGFWVDVIGDQWALMELGFDEVVVSNWI